MAAPNYDAPTRTEMKAIVARTLRDEDHIVFPGEMLNDFIDEAIADLSGYRPIESIETITYAPDPDGTDPSINIIPTIVNYIWNVEVRNAETPWDQTQAFAVPYNSYGESPQRNGWDYYERRVRFSRDMWNVLFNWYKVVKATSLDILLFGYRARTFPLTDGTVLDLWDPTDQLCLIKTTRMLGFQALNNDRALYQQWLAATNNTDVSPTQLQGMLNLATADLDRTRKRSGVMRRNVTMGPQYL